MNNNNRCEHPDCVCRLDDLEGDEAVVYRGRTYCSRECAQGQGCTHIDCDCVEFRAPAPVAPGVNNESRPLSD